MTNLEYILENEKELLLEAITERGRIVKQKNGKFLFCENCPCEDCIVSDGEDCNKVLKEMLEKEYVEPCPFEKDELVEVSDDRVNWRLRHFSHIDNESEHGKFVAYENGRTSKKTESVIQWKYCRKYGTLGGLVKEQKND